MAITAHVYTKLAKSLADKSVNLETDALKVMLLSAYTIGTTQDTAQYVSDVKAVATEVIATGYTQGGQALSGVVLSQSGHVLTLTCTNPTWLGPSITASAALFYDSTPGTDATNPVLFFWDFGGPVTGSAGSFTLVVSTSGLLTLTGA